MKVKKVYYKHYRYEKNSAVPRYRWYKRRSKEFEVMPYGGVTECHLVLEDNSEIVGISECSMQDNFNYKIGRQIAFGRAVKKYHLWLEQITMQKADWQFVYTVV